MFLASSCAYALEPLAVPQAVLPPPVLTGASRKPRGSLAETLEQSRDSWHLAFGTCRPFRVPLVYILFANAPG